MSTLPYFTFNGVKSSDVGIIVKEMPPVSKSEKNIESITISGRNGDLHIDEGTYKSKKYKITCVLTDITKIDVLKRTFDGSGTLELSTESNREYQAVIKNQIDFEKYLTYLKEFVLQFELYPIAYSKTSTEVSYTSNTTFEVGGTCDVSPKITITGIGQITLNNTQIEVLESGITIDCDLMNCTSNGINKNDKVIIAEDFPKIVVGNNTLVLGTGVESVTLSYKEGWI